MAKRLTPATLNPQALIHDRLGNVVVALQCWIAPHAGTIAFCQMLQQRDRPTAHSTMVGQGFIHSSTMQSYSLTEIHDRQNEVLDQATVEPVLLTTESQPSYVLLAADRYQQLVDRLALLEDCAFGQLAQTALERSQMVGTETFTEALQQIAHSESSAA